MDTTMMPLETDVLVLGTGGAGLRAAIAARQVGAEVLVVSKMQPKDPNCTAVAWGGATYAPPDQTGELFRQVVVTGGCLNDQRLVEAFVRDVPQRVAELADFGVRLEVLDGADVAGRLGIARVAGGSGPRGWGMVRPLRAHAEGLGVRFRDGLMVSQLLVSEGRVTGAVAVQLADATPLVIAAKAVVVATGGGAGLYARNDNPAGTTGDGIALAYLAGADLVDIELISFQFPADRIDDLFAASEVPTEPPLKAGTAHYFLGGIAIDERCRTAVPGLFAAGEAAGGLFGAGRLGGGALGDVLVFGAIAGQEAAAHAATAPAGQPDAARVREACDVIDALVSTDGEPAETTHARLRDLMWRYGGVIKSRQSLERGLDELSALEGQRTSLRASSPADLRVALETLNLLTLARPILHGSLLREETRGCFWRHDFPQPDDDRWLCNITWRREGGEDRHGVRPPVMTRLTEPAPPRLGAGCFDYLPQE